MSGDPEAGAASAAAPDRGTCPLPEGWRLLAHDVVGSTSDVAKALARDGAAHGTVVTARRQEAGRGRRGRAWTSPEGNLLASIVLRPGGRPARAAQLSFVAAIAVAEALCALVPDAVAVRCKWPNDVLLDGAKVSGILLESETTAGGTVDWLVVGIGVNVLHHPDDALYPTTSLRAAGAAVRGPEDVLEPLAAALDRWERRWAAQGFAPVRAAWLSVAHGRGGPVTARLDNATFQGRFADVDEDGALVIETAEGGLRRIAAGDVFFGGQPGSA
ncbi:biotin--[acetyl-CoA-carboxylase] ligase [Arenibaculum sp.]|jgi:BirA family biotin operon repressor/biotin-[acetyl-CoA-carboxylase] ligase|uniref:biotin--[acetyl-CoA-carboxylase] ligase n=1 Tax=Arenibaculum sp. TaxID=2865862 RepID=UPI002E10749B|nr:biotin--[acetyl-CoA-carboxylase] ligase [Arenibaculum sp.]